MGRRYFPLVYISLGSPLISPECICEFFKDLVTSDAKRLSAEHKVYVFVITLLDYTLEQYELWKTQYGPNNKTGFLTSFVSSFQPIGDKLAEEILKKLWATIVKRVKENINNDKFGKDNQIFSRYEASGLPKLVIAIDEARALLNSNDINDVSAIRVIRRALSLKAEKSIGVPLVTLVVADTHSCITNVAPVARLELSKRDIAAGTELIPPFFTISGYDIKAKAYLKKCMISSLMKPCNWWIFLLDRDKNPYEFMKLGIPLWGAFFEYRNLNLNDPVLTIDQVIRFSMTKLQGELSSSTDVIKNTDNLEIPIKCLSFIASMASRMSLTIVSKSNLANLLVASSMAQLDYLSIDRHTAFVSYPSDVTLAEGASRIINYYPLDTIRTLVEFTANSQINIGDGGKCVTEMILLAAMDKFSTPFQSITVTNFIKTLFDKITAEVIIESFKNKPILKGRIYFNHFVKLQESAKPANLVYYFTRGAAISGYPVQFGWDHCIPVCLEDGRLTAIFIQVKNYKDMMKIYDVVGIMQRMRLAGSMLLNPTVYENLWNPKIEKKPSTSSLGKRIQPVGNVDVDDLSMNILINLLQGQPLPADAKLYQELPNRLRNVPSPHTSSINSSHNFVAIQGFSLSVFPNLWGRTIADKREVEALLKLLLWPRSDYLRQLEHERSQAYVESFKMLDHGHETGSLEEAAQLHRLHEYK